MRIGPLKSCPPDHTRGNRSEVALIHSMEITPVFIYDCTFDFAKKLALIHGIWSSLESVFIVVYSFCSLDTVLIFLLPVVS